jgi:hypothetical protein
LDEQFDELARGLLRDPQVVRNVDHRRVASADSDKREAMGGSNIAEPVLDEPRLDSVNKLRRSAEE